MSEVVVAILSCEHNTLRSCQRVTSSYERSARSSLTRAVEPRASLPAASAFSPVIRGESDLPDLQR